ncbi:Crp/Fnr family transcriptional regulator [Fusobacterium simiae]|nr:MULTISPECIES: Crp/Fnr family transcriptional regulator [Fusobacterium]MDC7955161.1 Crp/Fnr family transcriptional regulator [Fusobacterium simiae]
MKTNESDIKRIEVFKGISKNSIKEIKNNSDTIELKKNKALYSDRQVLNYIYFLISGNVSLIKSNENGESKVIFLLGSGSMINEPLMRKNTSGIECWGFENSKILRINLKVFDKIMENDYILAKNCMFFMERRIRRLYRQLKNSTSASIEKKLTAKLYRLGTQYGINDNQIEKFILINLNLTVTYIAKMLGHQRETISRAIKILEKKDIILLKDRRFFIDMEKARQFFKK